MYAHSSPPARLQYLFYCILLYGLKKAPPQRCPRARTDNTNSLSLSLARQVRAEVGDKTGRPGESTYWRPYLYQGEVQCYANRTLTPLPAAPPPPCDVILDDIKKPKEWWQPLLDFPLRVLGEGRLASPLCTQHNDSPLCVCVSTGRSARHHCGLGVPHLPS